MQPSASLARFPVSWFASVMGLSGLTLAWERVTEQFLPGWPVAPVLFTLALALFAVLTATYGAKIVRHPRAVRQELAHPVKLSYFPAFSVSLILLATAGLHYAPGAAHAAWLAGSGLHLLFTFHVMSSWIHHEHFEIQHINPAWFIPVVGNILVPIAGVALGYAEVAWFFFSIGVVFWGVLLAIIVYRMLFHTPLPGKLLPTLFILIAPPAAGFLAYQQLNGGELDTLARVLYYIGLFLTLLLLTQARRFLRLPFFLSWWAYSFPLAAITTATLVYAERVASPALLALGGLLVVLVSAVILLLAVLSAVAVWRHGIAVGEE
ncbi:MAG: SLAC1 anion channel family protein [Halofilum sp. (in: g-proteobacteria)]